MDLEKESQLTFEDFRQRVSVVNARLATALRNAFISRFVDTESPHYQDHIATSELVSEVAEPWAAGQNWDPIDERDDAGNIYYWGYLWDFFIERRRITEEEVESRLRDKNSVYAMWDIHSPRKIKGYDNYWKFPVSAILNLKGRDLLWGREFLPEDLYIFDGSLDWAIALTHEYDEQGQRILVLAVPTVG